MALKVGLLGPPMAANRLTADATFTICSALLLNCSYKMHPNLDYGDAYENGTGTGIVGAVQRGEYDIFEPVVTPTYNRHLAVDFSNAYFYGDFIIVTRTPSRHDGLSYKILLAFKWDTWCAFLASMIGMAALMVVSLRTILPSHAMPQHSMHWFLALLRHWFCLVVHKHDRGQLFFDSMRMLVTFWSLSAIIIQSAYTGIIFSSRLTSDGLPYKDFPSLVTCIEEGRCGLIAYTNSSSYMQMLIGSESGLGQRIRATFKARPLMIKPVSEIPKLILKEQDTFLVWIISRIAFDLYVKSNQGCEYYIVQAPYNEMWTIPIRKGFPLKKILNRGAIAFRENGLAQAAASKYENRWSNYDPSLERGDRPIPDLSLVKSVVSVLAVGISIAIVTLGAEVMVYHKIWRRIKR